MILWWISDLCNNFFFYLFSFFFPSFVRLISSRFDFIFNFESIIRLVVFSIFVFAVRFEFWWIDREAIYWMHLFTQIITIEPNTLVIFWRKTFAKFVSFEKEIVLGVEWLRPRWKADEFRKYPANRWPDGIFRNHNPRPQPEATRMLER